MQDSSKPKYVCVLSKRAGLVRQLETGRAGKRKAFKRASSCGAIFKLLAGMPLVAVWVDTKFMDQNRDALETALYLKDCLSDIPVQLISEQASHLIQAISNLV